MNVNTLIVTPEVAEAKLERYQQLIASKRTREDEILLRLYKAVKDGARVLNLPAAFKQTGLNVLAQPKLAIARADWRDVRCVANPTSRNGTRGRYHYGEGTVGFTGTREWNVWAFAKNIVLPNGIFTWPTSGIGRGWYTLRSAVPHVPPECRPKRALSNYFILFEVEKWEAEYPVDPFLLERVAGHFYIVRSEWELTPLEADLLASMRAGN